MTAKGQTPIADPLNELLGAGAVYFNYDEEGETAVGATKGGSVFNVERQYYESEQDGAYGPIKGDKTKIRVVPMLTVNAMEIMPDNVKKFYAGMDVDDSNTEYVEMRERLEIKDEDYLKNVAFVGETKDGKDVVIIIENPLGDGETDISIEAKENVVPEIQFTGHYTREEPRKIPYKMRFPNRTPEA